MNTDSKNPSSPQSDVSLTSRLFDDWIDPIETGVRARVRDWIEALVHSELDTALQRPRYGRSTGGETEPAVAPVRGYRNGSRTRTLTGTFGKTDITVPRARLQGADGATTEWKSKALRAYQRRGREPLNHQPYFCMHTRFGDDTPVHPGGRAAICPRKAPSSQASLSRSCRWDGRPHQPWPST